MTQIVKGPDGAEHEFPDEATPDMIAKALSGKYGDIKPPDTSLAGTYRGVRDAVLRGATFGLSDEVSALGAGTGAFLKGKDFSEAYNRVLNEARTSQDQFRGQAPVTSGVAEFVGGMAGSAPGRVAATVAQAAPSIWSQVGQGTAMGAGFGALSGVANAEGGPTQRLEGGLIGGTVGGALGGAIPLGANLAIRGGTAAANMLGLRNPETNAVNQVLRAVERDQAAGGPGLPEIQTALRTNQAAGVKPEIIPDVAGENVKSLASIAARQPSAAKATAQQMVADRVAQQADRVSDDVARLVSPNRDFYGTIDALVAQRSAAADPLYRQAETQAAWSPRLQEFLDEPTLKEGLKRGVNMLRREAVADGRPFDPAQLGITFKPDGEISWLGQPNMRILDAAKRGLDDILEQFRDKTTGRLHLTPEGRSIEMLRKAYLRELDNLSPIYAKAREAFAGPSEMKDALALGRAVLGTDSEVTAKMVASLTPGEREMFLAGVARAIRDKVGNAKDGMNVVDSFFSRPAMRDKLKAAFPSEQAFEQFAELMKREANMATTNRMVNPRAGSPTAPFLAAERDMATDPATGVIGELASGRGLLSAATNAAGALYRRGQGINSATADQLGNLLFSTNPAENQRIVTMLMDQVRRNAASGQRRQELLNALLASGGVVGGRALAPTE